jgi:hypothetical protein
VVLGYWLAIVGYWYSDVASLNQKTRFATRGLARRLTSGHLLNMLRLLRVLLLAALTTQKVHGHTPAPMCSEDVAHTFQSAGGFMIRLDAAFTAKLGQKPTSEEVATWR